jgi:hypothetical protein
MLEESSAPVVSGVETEGGKGEEGGGREEREISRARLAESVISAAARACVCVFGARRVHS